MSNFHSSEQRYRLNNIDNNNNYIDDIYERNNDRNTYYVLLSISIIIPPIKYNWRNTL